ncbi:LysR family transcriptional regulator [Streptomyces sioyaensis]|uniref:LysR family transcriptional regulator n=1 Tax=Streptomyces sioyaensis TaxID=67364 RepID=UPI0037D2958B
MIDPRLQTLRVLHELGTVTATAEALHLTPSTVSQQLRQLSARLGLLEPAGRNVRLTPAALALVEHADALFLRWEEGPRGSRGVRGRGRGTVADHGGERYPVVRVPLRGEPLPVRRFVAAVGRGTEEQPPIARAMAALCAAAGDREAQGV